MLALRSFELMAGSEFGGELEQAVQTTAAEDFCRGCGPGAVVPLPGRASVSRAV